jgi:prepilin-type N-terminal cleavage/methylation domain-containing protein
VADKLEAFDMRCARNARSRPAFTLVELLVSLALILFLMTIISEAFGAAATTFRNLKAIGDMCQKLRSASNMLRRDLAADHFEGKKRLSDPSFWQNGPPREGYFRIYQDTNPTLEGYDLDNIRSYISANQILRFTSKFHGNARDDYFVGTVASTAPAPLSPTSTGADSRYEDVNNKAGNLYQFRFEWAELAYFLRPQKDPVSLVQDTANGQPLYSLYRRQWLSCVDDYALNQSARVPVETVTGGLRPTTTKNMQFYLETSTMPDPVATGSTLSSPSYFLYFNSPIDLTVPPRRMGTTTDQSTGFPTNAITPPSSPYVAFSPSAQFDTGSLLLSIPTLAEDVNTYSATNNVLTGSDLLVPDVISMDVRVLIAGNTDFVSIDDSTVQAYASTNPNFNVNATSYSSSSTTNKYLFDTWSSVTDDYYDFSDWLTGTKTPDHVIPIYQNSSGQTISIKAIQVVIRIWDFKTNQARQVTVVQDL